MSDKETLLDRIPESWMEEWNEGGRITLFLTREGLLSDSPTQQP